MISDEVQEQILAALRAAKAEGKLGLTTRKIAQQLGTYRARIMANASVLQERKLVKCEKISTAWFWSLVEQ